MTESNPGHIIHKSTGNKCDNGRLEFFSHHPFGKIFFNYSPGFAEKDHHLRFRVIFKQRYQVQKIRADYRVPPDPDTGALPDPVSR
mgnify:CR=1 FL=1